MDEVDRHIRLDEIKKLTESRSNKKARITLEIPTNSYFSSPEAVRLFKPKDDEITSDCLERRINLLRQASTDDDTLLSIISDVDDINELTNTQRKILRFQNIYLSKAYELALQHMNDLTWTKVTQLAVDELNDCGMSDIKNEQTIRRINVHFRVNEQMIVSNTKDAREPKLFILSPMPGQK